MSNALVTLAAGAALACALLAWAAARCGPPIDTAGPPDAAAGPTVERVRALAHLVSARVTVADVRATRLAGYVGGASVVLVVRGEALLGPDLSEAAVELDAGRRVAVITLPQPAALSCRVDHAATRVVSLEATGLWRLVPGDAGRAAAVDRAYAAAERAVVAAAALPSAVAQARRHAEAALAAFFAAGGWRVEICWRSAAAGGHPPPGDAQDDGPRPDLPLPPGGSVVVGPAG